MRVFSLIIETMALTDTRIRALKASGETGKYTDGKGLYLEVRQTGALLWRYRYRIGGKENVYAVRDAMQDILMDKVGIFRNGEDLAKAVDELKEVHARAKKIGLRSNGRGPNPELSLALRLPGMVRLAQCVAYGAQR